MSGHTHNKGGVGTIIIRLNTGIRITHTKYKQEKTKNWLNVHTENEQSNEFEYLGRLTPKGKQVAPNVAHHYNAELYTNAEGVMYPVVVLNEQSRIIRGEYYPIGYHLNFPKYWGKKTGVEYLLKHNIKEQETILQQAQTELERLRACLQKVQTEWPEGE